jgi:hypothetical protein
MLTGGQAKIAAKAPPPNKIDEKDFAVLRAEKAKGRGMGLQDEKVKPGKVQKAMGGGMMKKYNKGGGADQTRMEKLKFSLDKNIKGLKDRRKAGLKLKETVRTYALANSMKDKDRLTESDIKKARSLVKGKMGGGMMQKPMGYKSGTSVKVKCKLGRNKPTKMY